MEFWALLGLCMLVFGAAGVLIWWSGRRYEEQIARYEAQLEVFEAKREALERMLHTEHLNYQSETGRIRNEMVLMAEEKGAARNAETVEAQLAAISRKITDLHAAYSMAKARIQEDF